MTIGKETVVKTVAPYIIQTLKLLLGLYLIEAPQFSFAKDGSFLIIKPLLGIIFFRETLEETNTEVEMGELYAIYNVPQINQVYMLHLAKVISDDFSPTSESLEVQFFKEDEIPWDELAFPFVPMTLKNFFSDGKVGEYPLTTETIERKK